MKLLVMPLATQTFFSIKKMSGGKHSLCKTSFKVHNRGLIELLCEEIELIFVAAPIKLQAREIVMIFLVAPIKLQNCIVCIRGNRDITH